MIHICEAHKERRTERNAVHRTTVYYHTQRETQWAARERPIIFRLVIATRKYTMKLLSFLLLPALLGEFWFWNYFLSTAWCVCASWHWQTIAIYCFSPLAPVLVSFLFFSFSHCFFFFFAFRNRCCCRSSARLSLCNRRLFDQTTNRSRCLLSWLLVPLTVAPINVWTYSLELGFWKICPFHFQSRLGRCCTAVWERRSGGNSAAPRLSIIMYISLSTGVTCDLFYRSLWLFLTLSNRCSLFFPPFYIVAMIRISNASGSNLKFNRSPEPDPDCGCALAQILK